MRALPGAGHSGRPLRQITLINYCGQCPLQPPWPLHSLLPLHSCLPSTAQPPLPLHSFMPLQHSLPSAVALAPSAAGAPSAAVASPVGASVASADSAGASGEAASGVEPPQAAADKPIAANAATVFAKSSFMEPSWGNRKLGLIPDCAALLPDRDRLVECTSSFFGAADDADFSRDPLARGSPNPR